MRVILRRSSGLPNDLETLISARVHPSSGLERDAVARRRRSARDPSFLERASIPQPPPGALGLCKAPATCYPLARLRRVNIRRPPTEYDLPPRCSPVRIHAQARSRSFDLPANATTSRATLSPFHACRYFSTYTQLRTICLCFPWNIYGRRGRRFRSTETPRMETWFALTDNRRLTCVCSQPISIRRSGKAP